MATTSIHAPGGAQAGKFLRERFGLEWGADVYGIAENGVTAESTSGNDGLLKITLVAKCTRGDVDTFLRLLWSTAQVGEEVDRD